MSERRPIPDMGLAYEITREGEIYALAYMTSANHLRKECRVHGYSPNKHLIKLCGPDGKRRWYAIATLVEKVYGK
jgi:hypothetical protein